MSTERDDPKKELKLLAGFICVDGEEGDNGVIVSLDEHGNPTMYSINFGGDDYDFAVAAAAADKFKDIVRKHVLVKLEAALTGIEVIHGKR